MKRTWLAVVTCVCAWQLVETGSPVTQAFANGGGIGAAGGGGSGIIVDPGPLPWGVVTAPGAYTIPITGKVAGAANGSLQLVFTLFEDDYALYSETRTVTIDGEAFSLRFGAGDVVDGLPPSLLAGTSRAEVRWARASAPSVVLGTFQLAAAPYAMTLSPGAQIKSSSALPALTLSNTFAGLKATATGSTGRGVIGESTSGASASYGVEGRAVSASGAAGHFVNTAGDLIIGRSSATGDAKFRVANNGDVYVRGVLVGQRGPKGDRGAPGRDGDDGAPGTQGQKGDRGPGVATTFCVVHSQTNCQAVCSNGSELVASVLSPCSTSNGCSEQGTGSSCCVCTSTH